MLSDSFRHLEKRFESNCVNQTPQAQRLCSASQQHDSAEVVPASCLLWDLERSKEPQRSCIAHDGNDITILDLDAALALFSVPRSEGNVANSPAWAVIGQMSTPF